MIKIRLSGIYVIEHISGHLYVGESVDLFSRWQSHYTSLVMGKHSSPLFQQLWDNSSPEEWNWKLVKKISKEEIKSQLTISLKGKKFELYFKTILRQEERYFMSTLSKNFALNKDNKYFN